jgi:hypothetical protein
MDRNYKILAKSEEKLRKNQDPYFSYKCFSLFLLFVITLCIIVITGLFIAFAVNSNNFKNSITEILGVEKQIKEQFLQTTFQLNSLVTSVNQVFDRQPNLFDTLDEIFGDIKNDFNETGSSEKRRKFLNDLYKLPIELTNRFKQMDDFVKNNMDILDKGRTTLNSIYNTTIMTQELESKLKRGFEISFK